MTIPADQAGVAAFLAELAGEPPVETHISAVFRGAETVWKLKKAIHLAFLDFSDADARHRFLARELALNAPFVPGLYRDVVPVTLTATGYALNGPGAVVDWVLRMARVPAGDFLDRMAEAGRLEAGLLTALADVVAAMHAAQVPVRPVIPDAAARMRAVAEGNAEAALAAGLGAEAVGAWAAVVRAALERTAPLLQARAPLVRRAHGDLHLGNLLMWQGRPAPFDALEFDEALATIDPGYDLAFLLMDLDRSVSRSAANLVLNRYVARTGDAGLVGPLGAFLSLRAMIRAHVAAARGRDGGGLLRLASRYLDPGRPVVLAIGGLMGTGKSTLARRIAPGLGAAPGALVLRTDEIRKRLHGVAPEMRLGGEAYGPAAHAATEAALLDMLRAAAPAHAVIVDGTFLGHGLAAAVARAAQAAGVPWLGVWLQAPLAELERRVAARQGDASDATVDVLRRAAADAVPPAGWMCLDATDLVVAQEEVQRRLAML